MIIRIAPTIESTVRQTKTVHEHRAPTDESVRLLKEMETAAQKKLQSSFELKNNIISAVWHVSCDDLYLRKKVIVRMKINNKEFVEKFDVELHHTIDEIADKVRTELADTIARNVINKMEFDVFGALRNGSV
jgi:hypothetical protein